MPAALILLPIALLLVFGGAPLLTLALPWLAPVEGGSDEIGRQLLASGDVYPLLANSLGLALCTAALATAVGILPGVALGRASLRFKPAWCILFALPLLLPAVFTAAGWQPWAALWRAAAGPGPVAGFVGAWLVLTLVTFPLPLYFTALALRRTDGALEDLARLQSRPRQAMRYLIFGLARPGIALAWLLVFVLALSETKVPALFGLETYQGRLAELALEGEGHLAGAAALPLVVAAIVVAVAEAQLFGERGVAFLARTTRLEIRPLPLRWGGVPAHLLLAILALASLGLPLMGWAVALRQEGEMTAAAAVAATWNAGGPAFARSLVFALAGGSLAALVGLPLAYAAERKRVPGRRAVDLLLVVLFVVPGTVLASGLLRLVPAELFRLSAAALVIAFGVHFAVVPYRMERVALRQLGTRLEEAGMLSGAPWSARTSRLLLPLNAESLAAVWAIAVILAFRDGDLGAALSPAARTLAALGEIASASPVALAALSLVAAALSAGVMVVAALLILLLDRAGRSSAAPAPVVARAR
jgi:iron(III) transport system permease protein